MALPLSPSSGHLSIGDIRTELRNDGTNDYYLRWAGSFAKRRETGYTPINSVSPLQPVDPNPYAISEWFGYDHNAVVPCDQMYVWGVTGPEYMYFIVDPLAGTVGGYSPISFSTYDMDPSESIIAKIYDFYPFTPQGGLTSTNALSTLQLVLNQRVYFNYGICDAGANLHIVMYDQNS
jgi:hypothetical protein